MAELVEATDFSEDQIIEALNVQSTGYRADSLQKTMGDQDGRTLADTLAEPSDAIAMAEVQMAVRGLLDDLPERERKILVMRFFDDRSQQEIADEIGVSQMQVSRLLRRTLDGMRQQLRP